MTDGKTTDSPAAEPQGRWSRSAEVLATTRSDLPARLAELVGLPAPSGPLADNLITQTLDKLDALVPIGAFRTANDLLDATTDLGDAIFPPIPKQITSAQTHINNAISRLATSELHSAATQLGLRPETMQWGVRITLIRERRLMRRHAADLLADVVFDEVGYPDADSDDQESEHASFRSTVDAVVHSLRTRRPIDWDPTHIESLRCAVALHLARIGDAFLQTSERRRPVR
jgi:hypothetical protein